MRDKYHRLNISGTLAALWLRGGPRAASAASGRWPQVVADLRNGRPLRDAGHWWEAALLEDEVLLEWARDQIDNDRCLTAVDDDYPRRWLSVLKSSAPAAVWIDGDRSVLSHPRWLGFTGSRRPTDTCRRFVRAVAEEAVRLGFGIVSGGAVGCDRIAAEAARRSGGRLVELLPYGLSQPRSLQEGIVRMSACAPREAFTSASAMERNAWIYCFGDATLASQPRLREGGTWHGATGALRRRLGRVLVMEEPTPACRALTALGARPLAQPGDLAGLLSDAASEPALFCLG